ncbi:uncharacterized protein [Centroberyx affinis]|uniref:uncharacterized protein n=1 Tax=Centroberyx affinis TaxID=166261 RepID=UPI003A5BABE7
MLDRLVLGILLQGLTLLWSGPACEASSLGLVVHVVPLDSDGGKTVRAHFSVIAANPCPDLSGLCATGEDCVLHPASLPFNGSKPDSGWCVRQWQKTVPSDYNANVTLGSNVEFYVSLKAAPKIRENSGRLNQPPYVALPPPLRARVNCPHHIHLSVKDLDGDRVHCRFARADQGECLNCSLHSFIELDEEKCMLSFTGDASAGQYPLVLMVEDRLPVPKMSHFTDNQPLSSVPVHLSLTVEEASSSCSAEPIATGETPEEDTTIYVLPYEQVDLTVSFTSELESVLEIAVVGPPALLRSGLKSAGSLTNLAMAWVRGQNKLAPLLPICFAANTNSLQSEPRCVWLYQREMRDLPAGTELKCEKTEMTLVLPVATLQNINLNELQLNSPTCPVSYNSTHLIARISLTGCGTKIVHSGTELVYTNTLQSVRPYSVVSRLPSLVLPLACRIPRVQATGPQYQIAIPSEEEAFGNFTVWLEFHFPGSGPLQEFTRVPNFRHLHTFPEAGRLRRAAAMPQSQSFSFPREGIGSKVNMLDLHVMSDCNIERAEMMVGKCVESETEDFADSHPILDQGCMAANSTLEVITTRKNSRIYRLDMSSIKAQGTTMFVECTVYLCIATLPSQTCPDSCTRSTDNRGLVDNVFTTTYTIQSGPISLVVTTAAPTTTAVITTTTTTTTTTTAASGITTTAPVITAVHNTTTSHAPEEASAMTVGVICSAITIILQHIFLY